MLSSLQVRYTSTWAMMLIVVGFGFMLIVASRTGLSAAYPDPHAIKFEEPPSGGFSCHSIGRFFRLACRLLAHFGHRAGHNPRLLSGEERTSIFAIPTHPHFVRVSALRAT